MSPAKAVAQAQSPTPDQAPADAPVADWSAELADALRRSRRTAWIVAACAGILALCEALALAALPPLRAVAPYTISLDRTSGYIATVGGDRRARADDLAAVQDFLARYVTERETRLLRGQGHGRGAVTIDRITLPEPGVARVEVSRRTAADTSVAAPGSQSTILVRFRRADISDPAAAAFVVTDYRREASVHAPGIAITPPQAASPSLSPSEVLGR